MAGTCAQTFLHAHLERGYYPALSLHSSKTIQKTCLYYTTARRTQTVTFTVVNIVDLNKVALFYRLYFDKLWETRSCHEQNIKRHCEPIQGVAWP